MYRHPSTFRNQIYADIQKGSIADIIVVPNTGRVVLVMINSAQYFSTTCIINDNLATRALDRRSHASSDYHKPLTFRPDSLGSRPEIPCSCQTYCSFRSVASHMTRVFCFQQWRQQHGVGRQHNSGTPRARGHVTRRPRLGRTAVARSRCTAVDERPLGCRAQILFVYTQVFTTRARYSYAITRGPSPYDYARGETGFSSFPEARPP